MRLQLKVVLNNALVLFGTVLMGFGVLFLGILPWSALASANLKFGPGIPWSVFVELLYLGILWQFLKGRGWPSRTARLRREFLRANAVRDRVLIWSAIAGTLFACGLVALGVTGWMLVGIRESAIEEYSALHRLPVTTVIPLLIMGSIVTGVIEEAAFRGYMQVPLERRYGAPAAIGLVAVVFSLAHFPGPVVLPFFAVAAAGWGVLAYLTKSILPGSVLHALVDAVAWVWAWSNLESLKRLATPARLNEGPERGFIVAAALTVVFGVAATLAFVQLARAARIEPPRA